MERKVFFVDERLCFAINIQGGGANHMLFRCSLFFLEGWGSVLQQQDVHNQSIEHVVNQYRTKQMFGVGVYPGSWPTQQKLSE